MNNKFNSEQQQFIKNYNSYEPNSTFYRNETNSARNESLNDMRQFNYQQNFSVFDLDMNLLRYSEPFKLDNSRVEFCIGLIIEENRTILSFSSLDTNIYIGTYDNNYINNKLKWWYDN